ncbi:hypothetical protein ANN_02742 [Periplaneta americana]|uniref:Uncharacterized protein n=1 Tax=Periplaneta americana TaxID=6978 RepID=A0ABQ8TYT5_PERAM|nr:hypothetical protein ANN_02742 [Periplaneta americana]
MQRHEKVSKGKAEKSNLKWWIAAGSLTFVAVCAFIGITLWFGLNMESDDSTVIKNTEFIAEEIPSPRTEKKQQVVFGATNTKTNEENQRRSQRDGVDGKNVKTKHQKEKDITTTTTTSTTTTTTTITTVPQELFNKDFTEEAHVQEVSKSATGKENIPTVTTMDHQKESLTSGSPLYPQPIPETPTFIPENPEIIGEIVTPKSVPTPVIDNQHNKSTIYDSVPFSSTGTSAENDSEFIKQLFGNNDHNPSDFLDSLFHAPTEEKEKVSLEDEIANVFLGQGNKDVRRFDIHDATNGKGEHFMPQNFEYPHDRDHTSPQHFESVPLRDPETASLLRDHRHEILEDGIDRDGIPSLDHDDGLFYTPGDPERYDGEDPDSADNPFMNFLQGRLQELYNWLATDDDMKGKYNSDSNDNSSLSSDFMSVLVALNRSISEGNSSILLGKLKEMYYSDSKLNVTDPAILHNSSSLVSFGLLAFDLLLLRNVQQIAWEEEKMSREEMMKDPEVLALNALFMPPEKVRQLQDSNQRAFRNASPRQDALDHDAGRKMELEKEKQTRKDGDRMVERYEKEMINNHADRWDFTGNELVSWT